MKDIDEIKVLYDYGYGYYENKLIALFRSGEPDFETADELLRLGADINAEEDSDTENVLSCILAGYGSSELWDGSCDHEACEKNNCEDCPENLNQSPASGAAMTEIIRYFLGHGFDVEKKNGRYGAQCLWALTLSSYDRYMIDAAKLLLDAGAKNINISSDPDENETPMEFIESEGGYQDCCCGDHHLGNLYEAVSQVYLAAEEGRDYSGIDSYEEVYGKRIIRILSAKPENGSVFFDLDLPEFKHENCFIQDLFFVTDNGILRTTQYADFWFDTKLPEVETVDVSEFFPGIVGEVVKSFHYEHNAIRKENTWYGQPVATIEMENNKAVTFSINFGEVKDEDRAAFYYFGWPPKVDI